MIFSRNKDTDWLDLYKRRRRALARILWSEKPNARLLENAARLLLEAHYTGPWRMLWALFRYQVFLSWTSARFDVKVRFAGNQIREVVEREAEEEDAIAELVRQL